MAITRRNVRANSQSGLSNCNILLIEDQKSIANMLVSMLEESGHFKVALVQSYQEAKEILTAKRTEFFITISDLNLPDASNGEVIDLLIAHQQPIVAITGYFDQALHASLSQVGVIDYVLKKNINAYEYLVKLVSRLYFNQFIKVMVIDDSPTVQQITGLYLERQFLNVVYAGNGEEGLALLHAQPDIKLVLVDAEMPEMDGLTFTAHARQLADQNRLCIVGISSSEKTDLSAQFLKHGANDFISKPFTYDELTCRVNQNLSMLNYIEEIDQIAYVDFLTHLPNRRSFFKLGGNQVSEAIKKKAHLVVAIMDIDFFKTINDTYGHDCGDEVLKEVSVAIKTTLAGQFVARIGGEEFGLIINANNFNESRAILDQLMQCINELTVTYENEKINITVSIGATYEIKNNVDETLKIADELLYVAKSSGRNKLVWNHEQAAFSS